MPDFCQLQLSIMHESLFCCLHCNLLLLLISLPLLLIYYVGVLLRRNLEKLDLPVYSVKGHNEIINAIDGVGGVGVGEGAPEIVTAGRDGQWLYTAHYHSLSLWVSGFIQLTIIHCHCESVALYSSLSFIVTVSQWLYTAHYHSLSSLSGFIRYEARFWLVPRASIHMGQGGQVPSNIWSLDRGTLTTVPQYLQLTLQLTETFQFMTFWYSLYYIIFYVYCLQNCWLPFMQCVCVL